ncbi:hypothetical protein BISA_1552 [Bifidobacterium saguini DSM 23967]|uniref:DUF4192 family protein n=2 Tax=Bifidobacterium saguini TaxID=762210 RepID=A0A087DD64_9BIFI|nr:DUF4192 domain-containing protein [Bifidobacterium saguini]KFI93464.1 hypothetical protein BISA_1552 [Bifidobacterium saguini DSM 23967]
MANSSKKHARRNANTAGKRTNDSHRKGRHSGKQYESQPMLPPEPFDMEDLDMLSSTFHADRRERGPQQADADWVGEPLDEWLASLDEGIADLNPETMAAFAVGMNETLSIRDALILSIIIDRDVCPKAQLIEFASKPHSAHAKRRMSQLLTAAFEDESIMPDEDRCRTGVDMLLNIAMISPMPYCIQPLAVAAYTLWWLGDSSAAALALQCLMLDEDCSLAAMVFSAADRGVFPAWCACKVQEMAV